RGAVRGRHPDLAVAPVFVFDDGRDDERHATRVGRERGAADDGQAIVVGGLPGPLLTRESGGHKEAAKQQGMLQTHTQLERIGAAENTRGQDSLLVLTPVTCLPAASAAPVASSSAYAAQRADSAPDHPASYSTRCSRMLQTHAPSSALGSRPCARGSVAPPPHVPSTASYSSACCQSSRCSLRSRCESPDSRRVRRPLGRARRRRTPSAPTGRSGNSRPAG